MVIAQGVLMVGTLHYYFMHINLLLGHLHYFLSLTLK